MMKFQDVDVSSIVRLARRALSRFASRKKFVGVLGGDGLHLKFLDGNEVVRSVFIDNLEKNKFALLQEFIASDMAPPISLTLDILEQQYREVELPSVGLYDRRKMVTRKLSQTYGEEFLVTDDFIGRRTDKDGVNTLNYLFIGILKTEEVKSWLDALGKLSNPIAPLSLMPVELAQSLARIAVEGDANVVNNSTRWLVLIVWSRYSGFRQVILRDGKLVFTRLTPAPEDASDVGEVVENIESEFRSTVSYLRRLSFNDADQLELFVVGPQSVVEKLDARRMRVRSFRGLSASEFAAQLSIDLPSWADPAYIDDLIIYLFSRDGRHPPYIDAIELRRSRYLPLAKTGIQGVTAAIAVFFVVSLVSETVSLFTTGNKLSSERSHVTSLEKTIQTLKGKLGAAGVDPGSFLTVVKTRNVIFDLAPNYGPLLAGLSAVNLNGVKVESLLLDPKLTTTMIINEIQGLSSGVKGRASLPTKPTQLSNGKPGQGFEKNRPTVSATVKLNVVDSALDQANMKATYDEVLAQLKMNLPGFTIKYTVQPWMISQTGRVSGEVGPSASKVSSASHSNTSAVLQIDGPAK